MALEFLTFCQRNMQPCPVIAVGEIGSPHLPTLGDDLDVRTDLGGYRIWRNGAIVDEVTDIVGFWREDFVVFVIGCSFSFENALVSAGLELRHLSEGTFAPIYRTNIPLHSAGRFNGYTCVTMRPFKARDAIRAIEITSRFPMAHGAPIHMGDPRLIGIDDLNSTLDGVPVRVGEDEIPLFWGCGVSPQYALMSVAPEFAITHKPGCVLITDVLSSSDAMTIPQ
jgi:uncharacterized protein YcsI (UPF0317 family)